MLVASAVALSACEDNLDIEQKGVTAIENFYQTDEDAQQALMAAYQGFIWNVCSYQGGSIYVPTYMCATLCGDDIFAAGEKLGDNDVLAAINEFRYDAGNDAIKNGYLNYYYGIYYCNLVIDNFKNGLPSGGQTAITKRAVAEARVLRAYMHMMLALGWNNPPKVDHVLAGDDHPTNCDHDELLKWCAEECEAAASDLIERTDINDKKNAAIVTKGFAWAVAGKCYLFLGDYANAKTNLWKVIDSKKYQLVKGEQFGNLFHEEGDLNEEKIFEANLDRNSNLGSVWDGLIQRSTWMQTNIWGWRSSNLNTAIFNEYAGIDGWGGCGVPPAFSKEFVDNDGLDSYRLNASIVSVEDLIYGKMFEYEKVKGMSDAEKKASTDIGIKPAGLYGQSKYLMLKKQFKMSDAATPGDNTNVANHIIMRYAEVLLMYAEACVQTGEADKAKTYVNMIQERAKSKTISETVDMNVIKREKKLELWLEGCRWHDMHRWNDFDGVKDAGKYVTSVFDKLTRPVAAGETVVEDGDRFYSVYATEAQGRSTGYQEKYKWLPFPESITSKNPEITQNAGW